MELILGALVGWVIGAMILLTILNYTIMPGLIGMLWVDLRVEWKRYRRRGR